MKIRRALLFTSAERYIRLAVNLLTLAVVSRVLSPEEIGVAALGATVLAIAEILRDTPSFYLVQQKDLRPEDIRAAFTTMLAISLGLAAALFGCASLIASFYGDPKLVGYVQLLALSLLPGPFERPLVALLRRNMAFDKFAVMNVATCLTTAAVTVGLAFSGYSFMAFGWAALAGNLVAVATAFSFQPHLWMFQPTLREWRGALTSGGFITIWALLTRTYELVPYLVLSRTLHFDAVGLFSRARLVSELPDRFFLSGLSPILFPALASEYRAGRSLKQPYLLALEHITAVQWPALLGLAVLAHPVVHIVLGPQWTKIVPLVQVLSVATLLSFTWMLNYSTLMATGALKDLVKSALVAVPVCNLLLVFAALFGVELLVYGFVVKALVQAYVEQLFVRRHVCLTWFEFTIALRRSALVAACSIAGPVLVVWSYGRLDIPVSAAGAGVILMALGWVAGLWLARHPLLGEIGAVLEMLRPRRRRPQVPSTQNI